MDTVVTANIGRNAGLTNLIGLKEREAGRRSCARIISISVSANAISRERFFWQRQRQSNSVSEPRVNDIDGNRQYALATILEAGSLE
jgi:hypothetical protein